MNRFAIPCPFFLSYYLRMGCSKTARGTPAPLHKGKGETLDGNMDLEAYSSGNSTRRVRDSNAEEQGMRIDTGKTWTAHFDTPSFLHDMLNYIFGEQEAAL